MCLGFEGTLAVVRGEGTGRSGVLIVDGRSFDVGLAFVPEARPGDRLIAHTGQAVRVVKNRFAQSSLTNVSERLASTNPSRS